MLFVLKYFISKRIALKTRDKPYKKMQSNRNKKVAHLKVKKSISSKNRAIGIAGHFERRTVGSTDCKISG